jgi:hypothetical protein
LKKNAPKLVIHRETLRNLTGGQAAAAVSTQSPCLSIIDNCPSWWASCGCEPTQWLDCPQGTTNLTDTCAC